MNSAEIRKAIQSLIKGTSYAPTADKTIGSHDLFPKYQALYSSEALKILSNQINHLLYQYDEVLAPWPESVHNLTMLLDALDIKSALQADIQYQRKFSKVEYLGISCGPDQVDQAAAKLANVANSLAAKQWINASLYNLGMVQLAKLNSVEPDRVCVFSYLAVKSEHEHDFKNQFGALLISEGGFPPELEELE